MGMMIVTPIGTTVGNVGTVAGGYVDYLEGVANHGPQLDHPNDLDHPSDVSTNDAAAASAGYYADSIEGPGIWWGHGAERLGLHGIVDGGDLKTLLSGRHHLTGTRLLSAQGSAGRAGLKVGQPTRLVNGEPVWDLHDTAAKFDLSAGELDRHLQSANIAPTILDAHAHLSREASGALVEAIDIDSGRYRALRRGNNDDLLTPREAAGLLGVTDRYIRKVAAVGAQTVGAGEDPPIDRDYLAAGRHGERWQIRRDELISFDERREPPSVRLAYDVTFTSEKSISVLGLLGNGPVRDHVTRALHLANNVGLVFLEQHASHGRARGGQIGSEGLTVASYMHATSRNNDPFLHVHNVVLNSIEDANGDGRALDGRNLYLNAASASGLATAELRWQLTQQLGVAWTRSPRGVWEVDGISDDVLQAFSTRRTEIMSLASEVLDQQPDLGNAFDVLHKIARDSRAPKTHTTVTDLESAWWTTAQGAGLTKATLAEAARRQLELPTAQLDPNEQAELLSYLAGPDGATANTSMFSHSDVVKSILEWVPDGASHVRVIPARTVETVADDFLTSGLVVPLQINEDTAGMFETTRLRHGELWTTRNMVDVQAHIATSWDQGLDGGGAVVVPETLEILFGERPTITDEQRDLVSTWTTTGHQFQSALGHPGTGKTYAMETAARAWETSGQKVLGAAIKGEAARHLGNEARITADTVAAYLSDYYDKGHNRLDARTVLIVDEASTVGDRDLDALLIMATAAGATVRFIGDPSQHGAVAAGGMWAHLATAYSATTPELTINKRLESDVDIAANNAVRRGDVSGAFAILQRAGQLHEVHNKHDAMRATLYRFFAGRDANKAAPMVERANVARRVLNDAAQHVRIERGEVTNPISFGRHLFGVGDEIVARSPNRKLHPVGQPDLYVRNGTPGIVVSTSQHTISVDFDGIGRLDLGRDVLENGFVDLSYSITSLSSQGATYPLSNAAITHGATSNEVVVNVSRGRESNHLLVVGNNTAENHPYREPDRRTLAEQVADSVKPSSGIPAHVIDANAIQRGQGLAQLHHGGGYETHGHAVEQQLARQLLSDPPKQITDYLPPQPTIPHLREGWNDSVVTAGIYNARYTPVPNRVAPWGHVLGSAPNPNVDPERRQAWDNAVDKLHRTAAAITIRNITDHAQAPAVTIDTALTDLEPDRPVTVDRGLLREASERFVNVSNAIAGDNADIVTQNKQRLSDGALTAKLNRIHASTRHLTYAETIDNAINSPEPDISDLLDQAQTAAKHINNDLERSRQWYATVSTGRLAHPTVVEAAYSDAYALNVQYQAARILIGHLRHHHAHAPNPLIQQREQTVHRQVLAKADTWLTNHIGDLAASGRLTATTSPGRLAEWAGQAAVYRERWNTDPLATPTAVGEQAAQHQQLQQLHDQALDPHLDAQLTPAHEHTFEGITL